MSKNDNGTATYIFQLKGEYPSAAAPEGCRATTEVVGWMSVRDAVKTAVVLGIPEAQLGRYIARPPRYLEPRFPLITGAMLEKQLQHFADDYSEVEEGSYEPVPVDELDYETIDVMLAMLAEDVSTEDPMPDDWYYFPMSVSGTADWLKKHGLDDQDVIRKVGGVAG